jgi:malate dehydrogenase (oxaloacetate-decarboxylating)
MDIYKESLNLHYKLRGKIELKSKVSAKTQHEIAVIYTPGVAAPIKEIASNPDKVYDYSWKENTIAVVSDGTRILGLGNVGENAALPLLEGKSVIFKEFGKVNAIPISLKVKSVREIVDTIIAISPNFSGINLEDIAKPKIFEIEKELEAKLDIPIFHDDQHGTAIVVLAGIMNSLKVVGKKIGNVKIVILGAGSAGIAVTRYLIRSGAKNIIIADRNGIISRNRQFKDPLKEEISKITNPENIDGSFELAIKNSDIVIGLSTIPNMLNDYHIRSMASDPIVFALTNPVPEILPEQAKKGGARIIATGRSDFPNQINNALIFPGIFRGALDVRSKAINVPMKLAAAKALAGLIADDKLSEENIIPLITNREVVPSIAVAVAREALRSGVARIKRNLKDIESNART